MSEVKVNKISPRSGTTVTLGDSGDTFTIPSGATINNQGTATNFGATGSASWTTTVKTGDFTAVAGEGYFVDTTSQEIDVTLPAGSPGAVVAVKDYANTWDTNNCIIISNGSEKIGGSTNNAILSTEGLAVTFIYIDSTQGWLVTDDGLQSVADTNPYMVATGGTETTSGNCKIHTFTGPGTFTVSKTAVCAANNLVSYVVVAGAGGGGAGSPNSDNTAGGGGAGGFREVVSPSSPYTGSPLNGYPSSPNRVTVTATAFPITVGAGGAQQTTVHSDGNDGSVSTFSTITSAGGGGGGAGHPIAPGQSRNGGAGGSGGGASGGTPPAATGGAGNTPPVSPAQGFRGGNYCSTSPDHASTGGGGATATGFDKPGGICGLTGGPGGSGVATSIPGSSTGFAGGGGGGAGVCGCASNNGNFPNGRAAAPGTPQCSTAGFGGASGGRARSFGGSAGTANKGGGGGGGGASTDGGSESYGGAGGSGVIIIRYRFQ
jgi:hypothetical protein